MEEERIDCQVSFKSILTRVSIWRKKVGRSASEMSEFDPRGAVISSSRPFNESYKYQNCSLEASAMTKRAKNKDGTTINTSQGFPFTSFFEFNRQFTRKPFSFNRMAFFSMSTDSMALK